MRFVAHMPGDSGLSGAHRKGGRESTPPASGPVPPRSALARTSERQQPETGAEEYGSGREQTQELRPAGLFRAAGPCRRGPRRRGGAGRRRHARVVRSGQSRWRRRGLGRRCSRGRRRRGRCRRRWGRRGRRNCRSRGAAGDGRRRRAPGVVRLHTRRVVVSNRQEFEFADTVRCKGRSRSARGGERPPRLPGHTNRVAAVYRWRKRDKRCFPAGVRRLGYRADAAACQRHLPAIAGSLETKDVLGQPDPDRHLRFEVVHRVVQPDTIRPHEVAGIIGPHVHGQA